MTPQAPDRAPFHLTKHHGVGNDFLVTVDLEGARPLPGDLVRALCDRRFGIGADGVIRILRGAGRADLSMVLQNADGREAEMSGNGMRCLAQAAVLAGLVEPPRFTVNTAAGIRSVDYHPGIHPDAAVASVDLGSATLGPDQPQEFADRCARRVDLGNPHLVLLGPDLASVDVAEIGTRLQGIHPGGINVEFVTLGPQPDALTIRVWERGVGETEACGTGSGAAAVAVHSWGLVGDRVAVHNPGGTLEVELTGDRVALSGPVHRVAELVVDPVAVLEAARP